MALPVTGIGHIALRVTDLPRAKRFYTEALGFTLVGESERACFVTIGEALFALLAGTDQTAPNDRFDPFRVGLDHLALAVPATALPDLQHRLDPAGGPTHPTGRPERSGARAIPTHVPEGIHLQVYTR